MPSTDIMLLAVIGLLIVIAHELTVIAKHLASLRRMAAMMFDVPPRG